MNKDCYNLQYFQEKKITKIILEKIRKKMK